MLTYTEWALEVKAHLPEIAEFASSHAMALNEEAAVRLLDQQEFLSVLAMLQAVCDGVEETHGHRSTAHVELCQLCERYPHTETH